MEKIYTITQPILSDPLIGSNPRKLFHIPQDVLEWGGRICYRSTPKFRTSPDFIQKIISVEHLDVLEHGYAGFLMNVEEEYGVDSYYYFYHQMNQKYPYLRVDLHPAAKKIGIYGNFRAWHQLYENDFTQIWGMFGRKDMQELILTLSNLAPNVFPVPSWLVSQNENNSIGGEIRREHAMQMANQKGFNCRVTSSGANVMLLGKTNSINGTDRYHATFQFNGISRALSHQLVRHRVLSFSQESQRYVDGTNFQYVLPNVDNESKEDIKETINFINEKYRNMRNRKVKKEDARCILPNAAVTQIVVSGEEFGWRHFIEQRTASDAQPEIREVALIVQDMLGDKNGSNLS